MHHARHPIDEYCEPDAYGSPQLPHGALVTRSRHHLQDQLLRDEVLYVLVTYNSPSRYTYLPTLIWLMIVSRLSVIGAVPISMRCVDLGNQTRGHGDRAYFGNTRACDSAILIS